ncbi:Hsp70 protein-domain-containing protein [Armillaria mellea]|nr:Hsp70 protein-domain-containing protein [Armillaria mellea]
MTSVMDEQKAAIKGAYVSFLDNKGPIGDAAKNPVALNPHNMAFNAVITVPAYSNNSQHPVTNDTGTISNMNVLHIINEPITAATAYSLNDKVTDERDILIFNLGRGAFDASFLIIEQGLTLSVLQSLSPILYSISIPLANVPSELSSAAQASIEMDSLFMGIDFHTSLTHAHFEELCNDFFRTILDPVE